MATHSSIPAWRVLWTESQEFPCMHICVHAKSLHSSDSLLPICPWDFQARILEWVAMPSSRGSSQPRDQTHVSYISCIGRQVLYL